MAQATRSADAWDVASEYTAAEDGTPPSINLAERTRTVRKQYNTESLGMRQKRDACPEKPDENLVPGRRPADSRSYQHLSKSDQCV